MERIFVSHSIEPVQYPTADYYYSPSAFYPEYPFGLTAHEENKIYDIVRKGLYRLGYDSENYGTNAWNPLGKIIKPGDTVLLKPNWVMHENQENQYHDMECLVTHPSLIRSMIDYVVIALRGTGRIILGDAPMAQCHFNELIQKVHYDKIIEFYAQYGIEIILKDMRGCVFEDNKNKLEVNNITVLEDSGGAKGCIVNVGKRSAFNEYTSKEILRLKAPKLDPLEMKTHHTKDKHEYSVHKDILKADVIINLPKPKAHRKAGMTACCKNFIGANVRKDLLPHLTYGSKQEHGDAYPEKNILWSLSNICNDKYDYYTFRGKKKSAIFFRILKGIFRRMGTKIGKEAFWEGSWYGNDTMWRTISDVDNVIYYANKEGVLENKHCRTVFSVCDMVIAGEKEGPLCPSPKRLNTIIMSESHIACIDKFICRFIWFDDCFVKNIDFLMAQEKIKEEDIEIVTEKGSFSYFTYPYSESTRLQAGYGWHGYIEL